MSWNNVLPAWVLDEKWEDTLALREQPNRLRVQDELAYDGRCPYCRPHHGENAGKPKRTNKGKNPRRR